MSIVLSALHPMISLSALRAHTVAALLALLAPQAFSLPQTVVVQDDFGDSSLDEAKWDVVLPFSDSSLVEGIASSSVQAISTNPVPVGAFVTIPQLSRPHAAMEPSERRAKEQLSPAWIFTKSLPGGACTTSGGPSGKTPGHPTIDPSVLSAIE